MSDLSTYIRTVPDFPKEGIGFKDITTLLKNGPALKQTIEVFADQYKDAVPEKVVGIESRGFIFGTVLAYRWEVGFVPVRKPGKLPAAINYEEYQLEYGSDRLEIHKDAISEGERVLIVDDLLATGGTAAAAVNLVESLGGHVQGLAFLIELGFLNGREKLLQHDVFSIINYDSE